LPAKHTPVFPLRRYGFIGGAATLLVVLVSWVAVRAVGPAQPDTRVPLMVQPTMPLAAGAAPSLVPSARPSGTPSATPSVTPASRSASPSASKRRASKPPTTKPKRSRTPAPKPSPAAAFTGTYSAGGSWERGFIGAVQVTNKSGPARGWTVRITFADRAGVRVGNTWNARVDRQGNTFVFTGEPLAPGATTTLGFQASKQVRGKIEPTACTVDGASCRLS
jgi:hypothetical protein